MLVWLVPWATKALFSLKPNRASINRFFLIYFPLTGSGVRSALLLRCVGLLLFGFGRCNFRWFLRNGIWRTWQQIDNRARRTNAHAALAAGAFFVVDAGQVVFKSDRAGSALLGAALAGNATLRADIAHSLALVVVAAAH